MRTTVTNRIIEAVNWNSMEDNVPLEFWNQNIEQFWTDDEIDVSGDTGTWKLLSSKEQEAYKKVLAGLTLLDTEQGGEGMPLLVLHEKDLHVKAVLQFMGAMEEIHAKSYSAIFSTLTEKRISDAMFEWVKTNSAMQKKANIISNYYRKLFTPNASARDIYMAKVASVFLESYLFYSGFFYPLYLAGQGILTNSAEIIKLILRDESIHGLFISFISQKEFNKMSKSDQISVENETRDLLMELYEIEREYTEEVYGEIGLVEEVNAYVRYNANRAMSLLGFEPMFEEEDVNVVVLNGLDNGTANHDFFSQKGNGYVKNLNRGVLKDDDFEFDLTDPLEKL